MKRGDKEYLTLSLDNARLYDIAFHLVRFLTPGNEPMWTVSRG